MRFIRLSAMGLVVTALVSCSSSQTKDAVLGSQVQESATTAPKSIKKPTEKSAKKATVVASFYPLAFVAERLVGDIATIVNLTPPGVEPHDLELSPDQAGIIEDATLVLAMGQGLQPSIEDAAKRRKFGVVSLLDRLGVKNPDGDAQTDEHPDEKSEADATHTEENLDVASDPHIWLDPQLMQNAVAEIATALAKEFPDSLDEINIRSTELGAELRGIDDAYAAGLAGCSGRVIITSHAAFGRMANRYGLRQEAIVGVSPDAEPTADRLATLADLVKTNNVTTIFAEELVSRKTADTLAREAGVTVAVLNPIEGEPKQGNYLSAMIKNLTVLRTGLAC